jgi:hypothetical protein
VSNIFFFHFCYLFDRIYWIIWIIFLYLKFPPARNASQREAGGEEIPNEQSATPKRETLAGEA